MKSSVKEVIPHLHPLVKSVHCLLLRFFELKGGLIGAFVNFTVIFRMI